MVRATLVAVEVEERLALGGHEVAGLVEDVVGGQQHLGLREDDVAALRTAAQLVARLPVRGCERPT